MTSIEDRVEDLAGEFTPRQVADIFAAAVDDLTEDVAFEYIEETFALTGNPGRHSMNYCLLCNPEWNGAHGENGTEAIGKYEVEDIPGENQLSTGWHGVCRDCANDVQRDGYDVVPLSGHETEAVFTDTSRDTEPPKHDCSNPSWTKASLVTEAAGFDWLQCDTCGIWAKRPAPEQYEIVGYDDPR